MTSRDLSLVVVSAGVSTPSSTRLLADQIAQAVSDRLRVADVSLSLSVVELREMAVDIAAAAVGGGRRSPTLEVASRTLAGADAVVAATPVFAGSYAGLFKSFFDIVEPSSMRGTPTLIAATGGSERHSLVLDHAMRPLFAYLGAFVLPTGVYAATADFGAPASSAQDLKARIDRAAEELASVLAGRSPHPDGPSALRGQPTSQRRDELEQAESREAAGVLPDFEALLPPQSGERGVSRREPTSLLAPLSHPV